MSDLVIAPPLVLRGRALIPQQRERLAALAQRWLLVGGPTAVALVLPQLAAAGMTPVQVLTLKECTVAVRQQLARIIADAGIQGVLACGGGQSAGCG